METGSLVWFSSEPRPFVIEEEHCDNPSCPRDQVQLTFTRIDHPEGLPSAGMSFRIRVDLDTWQECDPPRRPPLIDSWVREFLSQYPEARRAEFRAHHAEGKRLAQQVAEYTLEARAVLTGELVSYADVLTGGQALSSGGRSYTHRFTHQGREYLVEDLYCANPTCDCRALHVQFWERVPSPKREEAVISTSFLARVTFSGQLKIEQTGNRKRGESLRILTAWWQEHQHDLDMLQRRYERVKEVGQRSITTSEKQTRQQPFSRLPSPDRLPQLQSMARSSPAVTRRTGRNDPCPCGSGKKFKRCCENALRNSQLSPR